MMIITQKKQIIHIMSSIVLSMLIFLFAKSLMVNAVGISAQTVSVKAYGAIGDGITDDRQAIQTALNNATGKTVIFPSGTYLITDVICIPSNTSIVGSNDTIIMAAPDYGSDAELIRIDNGENISISNIILSGNSLANSREKHDSKQHISLSLLDIWSCNNLTITNCSFIDNIDCAARLMRGCSNVLFESCNFTNVDCGIIFMGIGNVDHLTVNKSFFDGHQSSEPISFWGIGTYSNITISNNIMQNKTYGTAINAVRGTIKNLSIINNKMYSNSVGISLTNGSNVEIANNTIDSNGAGIAITTSNTVSVHDNSIAKTRRQAIYIKDSYNTFCSDNVITDCGYTGKEYHAIDLRGICQTVSITGNSLIRRDSNLSNCFLVVNCTKGSLTISGNCFDNCGIEINSDLSDVSISSVQ